jgi:lambda family phage portal protein
MSVVDKLLTGGAKRAFSKLVTKELSKLSANSQSTFERQRSETRWRGASQVLRSLASWLPTLGSGRTDLPRYERERMAARSYDAFRNQPIARAAISRCRTSVVGTGLMMVPSVDGATLGISEEAAEELNAKIATEWHLYYDNPSEVDIEATLDGSGQQSLAFATALLAGDVWALTPFKERLGGIYGLKIQLIDPARVSNPDNLPDTQTLQDGVEITVDGEPVAIYIRNRHPDDRIVGVFDAWVRRNIFAPTGERRVFQVWNDKDRIGSTRGAPYLAPILEPLQTLEQYSRAELLAAVVSAMFTIFIKKEQQTVDERGDPIPVIQGNTALGEAANGIALAPAAVIDLAPGEDIAQANPARPNANYDPFFLAIVTQIGAALEIPIDELLLRYNSSYSAARAAMLQAWRFYTMRRWWLVQQFCQPHYALWFQEAVARGRIPAINFADPIRRAAYTQAIWVGPARGAMDETQEATAAGKRIDIGVSNETIETMQLMGEPWLGVYQQRVRELKRRRADGTQLAPAPGQAAPPISQTPAQQRPSTPPPPEEDPDDEQERETP